MENQAHSLLESILISSQEVYYASSEIEDEMNSRLLNNANVIRILLEQNRITDLVLKKIAEENNLFRINIIDKNGKQIYSSVSSMQYAPVPELQAQQYLFPIFNGEKDTLLIGLRKSRMGAGFRYVVALASSNDDAIVLNLDAEKLLEFRRRVGVGILIRRLAENKNIIFSALEDENGIIAASPNVDSLKRFSKFDQLKSMSTDSAFAWEVAPFNDEVLFQAAHIFELDGKMKGLIRIGLSLEPLNLIYERITRKSIIIAIILFVLASVIFTLVFVKQDLESVQKQYKKIESFSNEIIQSVSDGRVIFRGWKSGYGRTVIIKDNSGRSIVYSHMNRYKVRKGQKVKKGKIIGKDKTGNKAPFVFALAIIAEIIVEAAAIPIEPNI